MLKFQEIKFTPQNKIIFLCGTKYEKKSKDDKRNVLKEFLEQKGRGAKGLILEEHFSFGKKSGSMLSYDDIFMKNLRDIEELSATFADGIIIIHDSISTGAELAAFASNSLLEKKICVLEPDSTGIEESKISAFLDLAFFREGSEIHRIVYYPEVFSYHISKEHIEKRTHFAGNEITPLLSKKLDGFLDKCDDFLDIKYERTAFGRINSSSNVISYHVEEEVLNVSISGRVLLYQMIALMESDMVKAEVRNSKKLYQHVDFIHEQYCEILKSSIQDLIMETISKVKVRIKENKSNSRNVVGYSLYMMQALGLIKIKIVSDLCQISMEKDIEKYWDALTGMLVEEADDVLTGLLMDE